MILPNSSLAPFAALDLGSLTVRLAIAERTAAGDLRILLHRREITGLGRGLAQSGELAPEGMDRTFQALRAFCQVMADSQVEHYRAVATHAVRAAKNGVAFLERLRSELNLAVEVLPPEEEARLSLQGVLSVLAAKYLQAPILVFDVGGGSSEFALVQPGQEPRFASLPLGVLTQTQARPLGDPPEPEKVAVLHEDIAGKLRRFRDQNFPADLRHAPRLVGTAGAVTTLAAMHLRLTAYDPHQVNNLVLTREQVAELARLISRLPEAERARLPGIEPAKAGVMVAGSLIILTILEVFGQDSLVVIDAGLIEGVLASFS
ncbi:MAG: exopolyphosphatase [Deltaproteobacteria bacterium]|nr:exopolyphosphatase [Deltaproteobacteria bacterium]